MSSERRVKVEVQGDHLERLARCSPPAALAELIWNALDADATSVSVRFVRTGLDGVEQIVVQDDGAGIGVGVKDTDELFSRLGGSWKGQAGRTKQGRVLHGKAGEGRFKAFALGDRVEWATRRLEKGKVVGFVTKGARKIPTFVVSEVVESPGSPGTTVTIQDLPSGLRLDEERLQERLTQEFALYLQQYNHVRVTLDGRALDPSAVQAHRADLDELKVVLPDGGTASARVTVIEWNTARVSRSLWLCDEHGFSLLELPPGIQAPGFSFTAYLRSSHLRSLADQGLIESEMAPGREYLIDAAKKQLREHFRRRASEQAKGAVARWQAEEVYPYQGTPTNPVEAVERQVFDICALNVSDQLPDFEKTEPKQKKLAFRLLKEAIEQNPSTLQTILGEVLGLSREKQDELADLLKQTTLSAIINASKLVTDRLNFVVGLEELLFDPENKKRLLERRQLHRLLAPNTWLFGEEYNLTVDDESLNTALARHLEILGREVEDPAPVLREDGTEGVLDLMLSRALPHPYLNRREHLVVELKRPKQSVDSKVLQQIKDYAFAVVRDERFRDTNTVWKFVAVSNELSPSVEREATQRGRPRGLVYEDSDVAMTVSVFTWSQIIEDARGRLEFFRRALDLSASAEAGREHLRRVYERYLPKTEEAASEAQDPNSSPESS
jgi:hypothetical protein